MKKTIGIVMILLMLMSVTVALAGVNKDAQPDKTYDGLQIFEKELSTTAGDEYVPDEFIVKFKPEVGKKKIGEINLGHETSIKRAGSHFMRLNVPEGKTVDEMVEAYSRNPNVEYAEPNYIARTCMVPNDPLYNPYQWHLDNDVYGGINMEAAWDISTGTDIIVAVIDTGVAYENYRQGWKRYYQAPDLADTYFVQGYDFVNDDKHPNDDNSHGTHVTGTIAQTTNNEFGIAGVAFNAKIMPVKVLDKSGSGYYSWIAEGIHYATDNGARVISLSLGGDADSEILRNAVKYAYENGVTVIAAAGNDASSTISYPAAYDDYVIAVGATRYDESLAYYSNYGPSLDLVAPGGDLNIDQNGDGYKDGVLQNTFNPNTKRTNDFSYWFFQGTSMATPHVSGVAALLIAHGNANIPDEIRSALQKTAKDKGDSGRDDTYGWGIVDAYAALQWTATPNNPPIADADGPCTGIEGTVLTFDGSGSFDPDGDFLTYTWNFGDGNTGTGVNPAHIYEADGTYTVTLIVNDGEVDSDPNTTTATISDVDPIAAFSYSPTNPTAGSPVQFTDKSTTHDGIISWNWNFDDGNTSTEQNPSHIYNSADTYTISLTVSEADGDSNATTQNITVSAPNQPPVAKAGPDKTADEGDTVDFDGSDSSDSDGTIVSYEWDFGDETTGTGVTTSHVYANNGIYTVTLTVTDNNGGTDNDTCTVTVNNVAPTAEAGGLYEGIVGVPITLTGSATDPGTADILTYSWDFGDGNTSTGETVSHSYSATGIYTAILTVTDDDGWEDIDTATVNVTEAEVVVEFHDSFEVSEWNGLWVEDSQSDWFRSTQRATDGSDSAEVDGRAADATLTMADPIDLSAKTSATLTFSWFIEGNWDNGEYVKLDISADGGNSWTENVASIDGTSRTYSGPDENHWIGEEINLGNECMVPNFTIRFRAKVSSSREDGNVDNVTITSVK